MATSPSRWARATEIFHSAILLPESQRRRFVADECGDDAELLAEVQSLVDAHRPGTVVGRGGLAPGTRVGVYEITAFIDAGGMGEVYRAKDTRLKRDVALKILPSSFADDAERRARFQREAEVLASLNHPCIAQIFGFEESGEMRALAMELVEGETLADRIARGKLSVDEAQSVAKQIAEALEAAHEQGIIHRDLKPANIKLTRDGTVKVLDFGLAKLTESAGNESLAAASGITVPMTGAHVLIGTPAYMSPEQARAEVVDRRTDIWAFACVLFEMMTGKPAFAGVTTTEVLAKILEREPDMQSLPSGTPPAVRNILVRAFEKDAMRRLRDIGEARIQLERPARLVEEQRAAGASRLSTWPLLPVLAGTLILAVMIIAVAWAFTRPSPSPPLQPARFSVAPPAGEAFFHDDANRPVAVSPDGSRLLYLTSAIGRPEEAQIYERGINDLRATPLPGTEGARIAFFSPDARTVGFITRGALKRVAISGGEPVTLYAGISGARGAAWLPDDTIVFTSNDTTTGLLRIPAGGGDVTVLTRPDTAHGEGDHVFPSALPGGRALLFTIVPTSANPNGSQIAVLDLETGKYKTVGRGGQADYVPSGHLIYEDGGTVRAVRFDLGRMEFVGQAVELPDQIVARSSRGTLVAYFAISQNGTLAYLQGGSAERSLRSLIWIDRQGREESIDAPPRYYGVVRVSPDGTRAVVDVRDKESDVWVWDFTRRTLARVTFDGSAANPVWTPDGQRIIFESGKAVMSRRADGTGAVDVLLKSASRPLTKAVTPDGRAIIVQDASTETGNDFMLLTNGSPTSFKPLLRAATNPTLSPDGRWLAYDSNESGRGEVYVRPFPAVDEGRWQISPDGGGEPLWSRDGRELFFIHDGELMTVPVQPSDVFQWSKPAPVFNVARFQSNGRRYDVSPDGRRFLLIKSNADDDLASVGMVVVVNWLEELKRLLPAN
jgi:serine/threonine-protein kinase